MDKEKANYIGIIWSESESLEGFSEALNRSFSQPVHHGTFESALGQKGGEDQAFTVGASPDDVLTVLVWTFAGVGFIMEMPEALAILSNWLKGVDPEQVVAFVASHNELIEQLTDVCKRCGYQLKHRCLRKGEASALEKTDKKIPKEALVNKEARAKKSEEMKSLVEKARTAMINGQVERVEKTLPQIRQLRAKTSEQLEDFPVLITT